MEARLFPARLAAALLLVTLGACSEPPERVLAEAWAAIAAGRSDQLAPRVSEDYSDPLGGKAELLRDVDELARTFARIELSPAEVEVLPGASKLEARIVGRLDVELVGNPTSWRVSGPLGVELRRDDGFQIRSGLLSDLRDIRRLAASRRAALEANDAAGYARLLHPTYRDGDVGREATAARLARDLEGVRIRLSPTLYRLELRGADAHLDEHYLLTVNDRELPAAIARLSLRPAAGLWKISAGLYPTSREE